MIADRNSESAGAAINLMVDEYLDAIDLEPNPKARGEVKACPRTGKQGVTDRKSDG